LTVEIDQNANVTNISGAGLGVIRCHPSSALGGHKTELTDHTD